LIDEPCATYVAPLTHKPSGPQVAASKARVTCSNGECYTAQFSNWFNVKEPLTGNYSVYAYIDINEDDNYDSGIDVEFCMDNFDAGTDTDFEVTAWWIY
ncbi:hypothetical protein N9W79_00540, partial [bacterium]|nr:hypothetical protein [bacterium]